MEVFCHGIWLWYLEIFVMEVVVAFGRGFWSEIRLWFSLSFFVVSLFYGW